METSVDTLVYQLEDEDASVRWVTLQKLRKIAAVETAHFPVRNTRRFLQCVRRRIVTESEPRVAVEALRLIADVMISLGDDVDQLLSSILPHLIPHLPTKKSKMHLSQDTEQELDASLALSEEAFQVFRKFVIVSNDLQAVADLLVNVGLANAHASVREASLLVVMRLLDERYQQRRQTDRGRGNPTRKPSIGRRGKALFATLVQASVPALEDTDEKVVVAAEEAVAKLELYWGEGFADEVTQFLSREDKRTLREHQEPIAAFLEVSKVVEPPPTSPPLSSRGSRSLLKSGGTSSSRPSSASKILPIDQVEQLHFGFLETDIMTTLASCTSNSNADWKKRAAAVERLYAACKKVPPAVLRGGPTSEERAKRIKDLEEIFNALARLTQDVDVHLVKRAVQVTQLLFQKLIQARQDDAVVSGVKDGDERENVRKDSTPRPKSRSEGKHRDAAFYMEKMLAPMVETAASFSGDDEEIELSVYVLLGEVFRSGLVGVEAIELVLATTSLRHRRMQVREEALKVWVTLLLVTTQEELLPENYSTNSRAVQTLGRLLGDISARVRDLALETAAVLATVCGCNIYALLETHIDDEYVSERVDWAALRGRLRQKEVLKMNSNGTLRIKTPVSVSFKDREAGAAPGGQFSKASSVDQSLENVSELRMMVTQDSAGNRYETGSRTRHSHTFDPGTGFHTDPTNSTVLGDNNGKVLVRGSISDRSYFDQQKAEASGSASCRTSSGYVSTSSEEDHAAGDIGDKLSSLKKKMEHLRRAPRAKRCRTTCSREDVLNAPAAQQQAVRSKSSPERAGGSQSGDLNVHPRVGSARVHQMSRDKRVHPSESATTVMETFPSPPQHSPQKMQSLQSSGMSYEDRPLKSKFIEENARAAHRDLSPTYISPDDRPIKPMASPGQFDETLMNEEYPVGDAGNNDSNTLAGNRKRGKAPAISLATRKRLEAKQKLQEQGEQDSFQPKHPATKSDEASSASCVLTAELDSEMGNEDGEKLEQSSKPTARPISLATRKRLEAHAKREAQANGITRYVDVGSPRTDASEATDAKAETRLRKKPTFSSKTRTVPAADEEDGKTRSPGLGKQEPRYLEQHEITPLSDPKQECRKALTQLRSEDWEANFEALSTIRRLAAHHVEVLDPAKVHALTAETLKQVPNLRSSVSKNALLALEAMCANFSRTMDAEIDSVVPVLLRRCADSNAFVCESATASLQCVVVKCSTTRVVAALASHLSAKAVPIRREVARAMHTLIVGQGDRIQISRDLPAVLQVVGRCLEDSHNDVRDAAKQCLLYLHYEQHMDGGQLKKLLSGGARDKVDRLLSGGAGYIPTTMNSNLAAARLPPTSSSPPEGEKRKLKAKATVKPSSAGKKSPPTSSSRLRKTIDNEALERLETKLDSSNWKERHDALQETTDFICAHAPALSESGKLLDLFDVFVKRMDDGNAKVNSLALECLEKVVPALGNGMEQVLGSFVPAIVKNLAANNARQAALAQSVVQTLCTHVDTRLLCQQFAAQTRHANSRAKPLLLDTLTLLAAQGDDEKSHFALQRYVLPLALEQMKEVKSGVKEANTRLLLQLQATLGSTAVRADAYKLSGAQQSRLSTILGPDVLTG